MQIQSGTLGDSAAREHRETAISLRAAAALRAEHETLYIGYVQTYYAVIVRYVYSMVPAIQQAEDLTQDAFLKAYLALAQSGPPENPRAWLFRIATNTCLDHIRRQRRFSFVALHDIANKLRGASPFRSVDDSGPLDRALAALRPQERSILLLFTEGGLKAPEVAEVLGITPAAARKRRQRAREAFTQAYREVVE